MVREWSITPQQQKILLGTIAVVVFFFAFLYFSLSYTVLILFAEIFLAVVVVNLLNRVFDKSEGLFQNETAIYLELGLALVFTIVLNQLGVNFATGLILLVGTAFVILLIFGFIKGTQLVASQENKQGRKIGSIKAFNTKDTTGGILRLLLGAAIVTAEFLIAFFVAVTYPLLTIGAILFLAFILSALVTGNNLDNRKALAFLVVALFIVFSLQQLQIHNYIPGGNLTQSLLNFNSAILCGILIFIFYYAFARLNLVKGEQTSIRPIGR